MRAKYISMNGEIAITAPAKTDWFSAPVPKDGALSAPVPNAPFLYLDVEGDFVFRAKVRPNHRYVDDACALMVMQYEKVWAKADFGFSATYPSNIEP